MSGSGAGSQSSPVLDDTELKKRANRVKVILLGDSAVGKSKYTRCSLR